MRILIEGKLGRSQKSKGRRREGEFRSAGPMVLAGRRGGREAVERREVQKSTVENQYDYITSEAN